MSITPYDLGNTLVTKNSGKIKIDDLVRKAQKEIKITLLHAQIEALGVKVNLTTSTTQFKGQRFWFICPHCSKRVGILYRYPIEEILGCRKCLNLQYQNQRYKGMIESAISL